MIVDQNPPDRPEPDEDQLRRVLEAHAPQRLDPQDLKLAAVLVPLLIRDGHWHVLLTRRAQTVETHKGEISFPGGHTDPEDLDGVATALRETEEEIGVPRQLPRVIGRLDDLATITGFRIRPYVAVLPQPLNLNPSPAEIDEIITLPIHRFLHPDRFETRSFSNRGQPYPVYYFHVDAYTVWGATARILHRLLTLAFNFVPPGTDHAVERLTADERG